MPDPPSSADPPSGAEETPAADRPRSADRPPSGEPSPSEERPPETRFTARASAYARSRPGYPPEVVDTVLRVTGLGAGAVVADVGAGTGLSSLPFLRAGLEVVGVEPNAAMRRAAESTLAADPALEGRWSLHEGKAEDTGLPRESVDLVAAFQAWHWFHPPAARAEFLRILRRPRWVALAWNARRLSGDPFSERFEALLLRHGTDYEQVRHDRIGEGELTAFLGRKPEYFTFPNAQRLSPEGLRERLLSTSYLPGRGEAGHDRLLAEVDELIDATARGGPVTLRYEVELWVGQLQP